MSPVPFTRPGTLHSTIRLTFADGSTARGVLTQASDNGTGLHLELLVLPEENPPTLGERARAAIALLAGKRGL